MSDKFMVTVLEDGLVKGLGSMLGDWGSNKVSPLQDMKKYVALGYSEGDKENGYKNYSERLQLEITNKCFEQDANYDKVSAVGKALRQRVLDWHLHDMDLGDEFDRVLYSHFGEDDPGVVTVRRMLNILAAYANSRRKNTNKELVKHKVYPLWNGVRIYFDRHGQMYTYDDDVPVEMEMFMRVNLCQAKESDCFEVRLQDTANAPLYKFLNAHYKTDPKWPDLSAVNFGAKKGKDRAPDLRFSLYKGQDLEKDGKRVRYWTQRKPRSDSRIVPKQMSFIEYVESPSTGGAT